MNREPEHRGRNGRGQKAGSPSCWQPIQWKNLFVLTLLAASLLLLVGCGLPEPTYAPTTVAEAAIASPEAVATATLAPTKPAPSTSTPIATATLLPTGTPTSMPPVEPPVTAGFEPPPTESPRATATATGPEGYWLTRPGGLASIDYDFPIEPTQSGNSPRGYYNIDFFIEVTSDPGSDLGVYNIPEEIRGTDSYVGYYWANQFAFVNSGNDPDGYIGIQTIGWVWKADESPQENRQDPEKNEFVKTTRLAIFSIWHSLDARPGGEGSYCAPYKHEGIGWSCKVEYPWREGVKYRLRIWEAGDAEEPNEARWWRGAIWDSSTGEEVVIGDILVPSNWSWLQKHASSFTEYYSQVVNQEIGDADQFTPKPRVCDFTPKAEVKIYPPTANNGSVSLSSMKPESYGKCAHVAAFLQENWTQIPSNTELSPQPILGVTGILEE